MTDRIPFRLPASLFGIPVGVLGLAGAWHVGTRIWGLPEAVGAVLAIVGVLIWATLALLYARTAIGNGAALRSEVRDPVQAPFVSLVFVSTMLVSSEVLHVWPTAAIALFGVTVVAQFALGIWLLGRTWQGEGGADFPTAAMYLPGVGQSFVAANGAAQFGWLQVGDWLLGCGMLSWFALESVVLGRAATRGALPPAMRPAIGVQLAPPVVGGLAYLSLTNGPPGLAAHMLFGYGLYQAALLLRLWPWIRQPSFSPGYWAFSFGVTALPTMATRMVERGDGGPLLFVAPALFVAANVILAYLAVGTVFATRRSRTGATAGQGGLRT